MARGSRPGSPARNPNWGRICTHTGYLNAWRDVRTLYAHDYEDVEERAIRAELEELGIPMGYGRVGRVPTQLTPMFANRWR